MTTAFLKSHKPNEIDRLLKGFILRHPNVSLIVMFVGAPILMLLAVGGCSTAVMLPISLLFGWI